MSPGERFLEVGAGAGLLALHAARITDAVATDVNPEAVALLRTNALKNRVSLEVVRTDLMAGLQGPFDVVAFNPPYLPGKPRDPVDRAWHGGPEGSDGTLPLHEDLPPGLKPPPRADLLLN